MVDSWVSGNCDCDWVFDGFLIETKTFKTRFTLNLR